MGYHKGCIVEKGMVVRMKRRKIALAMAMMLCVGQLAGCGDAADTSGGTESSAGQTSTASSVFTGELEENVTIQVLENDTAISKGYFEELINAFNETYAEYGITAVDANMDQYLDLANDGPYGYGPDVLYQANDIIMQYATGKHIYPLPVEKLECYDSIPEAAWNAYKTEVDGTTYYCGVPVNVQAPMLYYRTDLLPEDWKTTWDDNGNQIPDMIENWNDMYAFSVERHGEDSSKYGYMKSLYDVYFSSGFLFSYGGYVFGSDNTDPSDVGFSKGEAEKGAWVLQQLAGVMNEECIDDTITTNAYSKLADGTYFATISTPDVYSTFLDELVAQYESEGMSAIESEEKAKENLVMTTLPQLPVSGDLTEENPELVDSKAMGGVNGYAISAYTKYPNACLAFIDFATSYDMMVTRSEMLGVAPAREDAAETAGGTSELLYESLENGNISLMPSIQEVSQIWTPGQTFFTDLAKDAFRDESERKYKDLASLKAGLEEVDQQIYDAIFTLK
ncbi:MAG: extracellular solute-binding protein [Lachnospiraceae bacterium]|nr:extracellular solute-binding protein [Lachnospiraceae bacterium]